jgi:hypothetical protein
MGPQLTRAGGSPLDSGEGECHVVAAVPPTLLDTFRTLATFQPGRTSLKGAPWEEYVDWAIANGLAPLAAYNLEYRLAGGGAPEWVRDRLMSVYQGSLNDNVMKLVNFKRAVDGLEGRQVVLLGAAPLAEAVYPHVAFRPVIDLQLWVKPEDVDGFANFLRGADFKPSSDLEQEPAGATRVLSDGRTALYLYSELLGANRRAEEEAAFARATPMKMYGPSVYRLDLEDTILSVCLEHAREGYDLSMLSFVDLRELLMGAPSMGGPYSRPVNRPVLAQRAKAWKLERALYASASVVERLFPEAADAARAVKPELRSATRALLDRGVVAPTAELGMMRRARGSDRLRRLLSGGG